MQSAFVACTLYLWRLVAVDFYPYRSVLHKEPSIIITCGLYILFIGYDLVHFRNIRFNVALEATIHGLVVPFWCIIDAQVCPHLADDDFIAPFVINKLAFNVAFHLCLPSRRVVMIFLFIFASFYLLSGKISSSFSFSSSTLLGTAMMVPSRSMRNRALF